MGYSKAYTKRYNLSLVEPIPLVSGFGCKYSCGIQNRGPNSIFIQFIRDTDITQSWEIPANNQNFFDNIGADETLWAVTVVANQFPPNNTRVIVWPNE